MINTDMKSSKRWYYDAVVGYIVLNGYTTKEAKEMIRKAKLKLQLKKYAASTLRTPVEHTAENILFRYKTRLL